MKEVTKAQIEEWKAKYGKVFRLTSGDKSCYLKDPLSSLNIMRQAADAFSESAQQYTECIVKNCWLEGDNEIRTEAFLTGLEDQVKKLAEIPECEISQKGTNFQIKVEGMKCEVRPMTRGDLIQAEQKNRAKQAFKTNINLLDLIKVSGVDEIKAKSTRNYITILTCLDELKEKEYVQVEEL